VALAVKLRWVLDLPKRCRKVFGIYLDCILASKSRPWLLFVRVAWFLILPAMSSFTTEKF